MSPGGCGFEVRFGFIDLHFGFPLIELWCATIGAVFSMLLPADFMQSVIL